MRQAVMMVMAFLASALAFSCTDEATPCISDLDCKGDRICADGICQAPDAEGDGDLDVDPDPSADGDRESEDEFDSFETDGDRNESLIDGDADREWETDVPEYEGDVPDGDLDLEFPEDETESDTELDCTLEEPTCIEGYTCACNVLYECVNGYWEELQNCRWDTCMADEGICRVERALNFERNTSTKLSIESESASVCAREYWTIEMWLWVKDGGNDYMNTGTVYQDGLGSVEVKVAYRGGIYPVFQMHLDERHEEASNVSVDWVENLEVSRWAHIAIVRDYVDRRMYLNGNLVAEKDTTHKTEEREYEVAYIGYSCNMTLDEVRISDVTRYTEDFTPQTRYEPDEDTLSLWHMNEGSGDVTYDEVSGVEGDLLGNVSWTAGIGPWTE